MDGHLLRIFLPIFYTIFRFVENKQTKGYKEKNCIGCERKLQLKLATIEKIALGVFGSLIAGIYECFLLALLSLLVGWRWWGFELYNRLTYHQLSLSALPHHHVRTCICMTRKCFAEFAKPNQKCIRAWDNIFQMVWITEIVHEFMIPRTKTGVRFI